MTGDGRARDEGATPLDPAHPLRSALEVVRFLLELALLAALWTVGDEVGLVAAIALPLAAAVLWGALVAPKAARRLADPARLALELVLFAATGAGLAATGRPVAGAVLAIASAAASIGLRVTGSAA